MDANQEYHHEYYVAHKNEQNEASRINYQDNKEAIKKRHRLYRIDHPEDNRRRAAKFRATHRQQRNDDAKRAKDIAKKDVMTHYGNGKVACVQCGYAKDIDGLVIDHINGNGNKDREIQGVGYAFYRKLIRNNYPPGYQTLCAICNQIKKIRNNEHRHRYAKEGENSQGCNNKQQSMF